MIIGRGSRSSSATSQRPRNPSVGDTAYSTSNIHTRRLGGAPGTTAVPPAASSFTGTVINSIGPLQLPSKNTQVNRNPVRQTMKSCANAELKMVVAVFLGGKRMTAMVEGETARPKNAVHFDKT